MAKVIPMPDKSFDLTYSEYVREMGALYYYVDQYMKAHPEENVDEGKISTVADCQAPDIDLFTTEFFHSWAHNLYNTI